MRCIFILIVRLFYVRIDERSKFATAAVAGACRRPRIDIGERDRNAAVTVVMRAVVVTRGKWFIIMYTHARYARGYPFSIF